MRSVSQYSLIESNRENQCSLLTREDRARAIKVDGIIMEAQFELDDGSGLIWLTDDSPYDEGLHIYLLGRDNTIEDSLEAGADFTPGILKINKIGEDWVEFEFFTTGNIYRLEVAKEPGLRRCLPTGWKYKKRLSKHRLVVREVRMKESGDVRSKI